MSLPEPIAPQVAHSSDILDRLLTLHPKLIDLSLDRVLVLLDRLGRPQDHLPPVVHIAGTNGKGSVLAFMRAGLEASGYRVHSYISPHLVHFHERIGLAGTPIEEGLLSALLTECESANGGQPITFFEITTAAAFLAFSRTPGDVLLLETGLGGRLDATNVIDRPLLTVLTSISPDHQSFLGNTLAAIAAEKAAIQKPGVPTLSAAQSPEAWDVITPVAAARDCDLRADGRDWSVGYIEPDGLHWSGFAGDFALPAPALAGNHQIENAGLAVAALCTLRERGFTVPDPALAAAMTEAEWPARLQRLRWGPLPAVLPPGSDLWLDGGHNPAAAQCLADWAAARADDRPLHLVCGMMKAKDAGGFLGPLARHAQSLTTIAIPGEPNASAPDALANTGRRVGVPEVRIAETAEAALRGLGGAGPVRALICGSLYLAGSVLRNNG
ncbi:MAG: folylpolyglutamate synthase/dihydrofolate synthase family protein [Alphaproteobacteria bacterium]|nr:folylpolyglutamate synthase/dihydrofolate synthase family protein [Alphaproteobacteria bacterium]